MEGAVGKISLGCVTLFSSREEKTMIRLGAIWLAIAIAMITFLAPASSFADDKDARAKKIGECHQAALKVYPDKHSPEHQAAMARCIRGDKI
jgi:hypothetical protein